MRRELSHLNTLTIRLNSGEDAVIEEITKERIRLNPINKYDEEEHVIGCLELNKLRNERTKRI